MAVTQEDIETRVAVRERELGRRLTALELIEVINAKPDDEPEELTYELDEDQ